MTEAYAPGTLSAMKVALVHELLTMRGGAERVLKILADMFPDAPIYTLLYDEKKLGDWFPASRVRPSRLQKWAWFSTNHHLYLSKFPSAAEAFDFSEFDLVISSSSAFAHGIITNGNPKHLSYIHSPARYLWDRTHDVLDRAGHGPLGWLKYQYLSHVFHKLRVWDAESADRADSLLAASKEVQRRIQLYWRRDSEIVYPPIDDSWFTSLTPALSHGEREPYFLVVSSLVHYKRIELAIEAANQLKVPLKIAGRGPAEHSLKSIAGPTVEFLGFQNDEGLRNLYANAIATIFPGEEDFGLVPLESMACGTPVIAYRAGGALETIKEHETGAFFDEPTSTSLAKVMKQFDPKKFSPETCREQAQKFRRAKFEEKIHQAIKQLF